MKLRKHSYELQSLNSSSRALLMAKLDRSGTASRFASVNPVIDFFICYKAYTASAFFICSITGSGFTSSTTPIIGAAPVVPSLFSPTIQASVPTVSGLPGGLQLPNNCIPTINTIGIPSECLLLKNMFDPNLEVCLPTKIVEFFLPYVLN